MMGQCFSAELLDPITCCELSGVIMCRQCEGDVQKRGTSLYTNHVQSSQPSLLVIFACADRLVPTTLPQVHEAPYRMSRVLSDRDRTLRMDPYCCRETLFETTTKTINGGNNLWKVFLFFPQGKFGGHHVADFSPPLGKQVSH